MSLGSHSPEEEVGGQLQKDAIAKIQLKDTIVGLHSMREGVKNL